MDSRFPCVNNLRFMIFSLLSDRILPQTHLQQSVMLAQYLLGNLSISFVALNSARNLFPKFTAQSVVSDSGADSSSAVGFLVIKRLVKIELPFAPDSP